MKPRRLLTSVDLLPTILELQENVSLDDYMDSIRELSQRTYPLSGPMQGFRLSSQHPVMSLATACTVLAHKPWAVIGPESISITLTNSKTPVCLNQDPLDWLFSLAETSQDDLCMI